MNLLTFTIWPEMIFWPDLIIKGWLPYKDIAIAHNPLLILSLAGWMQVFGTQIWLIKVFTLLIALLSGVLLYRISKSILTVIVWIALWFMMGGLGLWFDLALVPLGLLLYLLASKRKWFLAGICWGIMFLTKQTAVWFLIPILFLRPKKEFPTGMGIILIIFLSLIWKLGILNDYWQWAIKFGIGILPSAVGQLKLPTPKNLIWTMAIIIPGIIGLTKKNWKLSLWAMAGIAGVWPRWEVFHFQPGLPFIAMGLSYLSKKMRTRIVLCLSM